MVDNSSKPSRRERLLAAGREAFGQAPYEDVQLHAIAKQTGVAHGLPFHYFGNKRGFFVEVVRSIASEMRVLHAEIADLPPATALRNSLEQHIDYFIVHAHLFLGPMRSNLLGDPKLRDVFDAARWDGMQSVLRMVGIEEPSAATTTLMRAWLAFHDDLLSRWLPERVYDRGRVIDLLYESFVSTLESVNILEPETNVDLSELRAGVAGRL